MSGPPPEARGGRRRRILFVAESVTLAHLARCLALARGLDRGRFEVILATAPRYQSLWGDLDFEVRPIHSIPGAQFLDALAAGRPLYSLDTLRGYVREDRDVLRATAPAAVVGDFRLSLSVSARLAGVPYFALTNAYWSPYARGPLPLPDLPMSRRLGVPIARALFRLAAPVAFALHARPLNRLRREHGLPDLGKDLRRTYTDADQTLYADASELVPTEGRPANHHYLGPILWSPPIAPPAWWDDLPRDRPVVYITLGSSGPARLLDAALEDLADLPVVVLAATAGRSRPSRVPPNARIADFLPGDLAAARARLVVCNGGSPTTQQALAVGTPVLGIAANMDQHLNMGYVERQGAGRLLRSEWATGAAIRAAVQGLLDDPRPAEAARTIAAAFAGYDPAGRLGAILDQ